MWLRAPHRARRTCQCDTESMRVYIPVHVDQLAACLGRGWQPERGFAITARLREITAIDDEEVLAEQVRGVAAWQSVSAEDSPLRAVIVADYSRADVTSEPGGHPAAVRLTGVVSEDMVACAFVDEPVQRDLVRAARGGDEDAGIDLTDAALLWFDVTELQHVPTG